MNKKIIILLSFFYVFAMFRYQYGKNLWDILDFIYTMNKALAWLAGTLLGLTLLKDKVLMRLILSRRKIGVHGYGFGMIHIFTSFCLLSPTYYSSFFENGEINETGYLNIGLGLVSFVFFSLAFLGSINWLSDKYIKLGKYGVLFNFLHVLNIGFLHWFPINNWTLYMPPITLLFILELLIIYLFRFYYSRKHWN